MDKDTMATLRELTSRLPKVPNRILKYRSEDGTTALGFGLVNTPEVCIQCAFLVKGRTFPPHPHDGKEWLIVVSGKCVIKWGQKLENRRLCRSGDYVVIPPGVLHSAEMIEDTEMIGITIPGDQEGYPNGV